MAAHQRIVLDQEDSFRAPRHLVAPRPGRDGRCGARRAGQIETHRSAVPGFGFDPHLTSRLLGKTINHAEPKAGPFTRFFGGEERLDRACQHLRRHADARIFHSDHHVRPRDRIALRSRRKIDLDIGGFDGQQAAIRHGIARVDGQIEDRDLGLGRIDQRGP
jgi:hypothetical protein